MTHDYSQPQSPSLGYGMSDELAAAILQRGTAQGVAATKAPKERASLARKLMEQAKAGAFPGPVEFPSSNRHSQAHANKLRDLAIERNREGLEASMIGGTNTYAKILRAFRDALVVWLDTVAPPLGGKTGAEAEADDAAAAKAKAMRDRMAKVRAAKAAKTDATTEPQTEGTEK